ncbi:DUF262 domain-containing protein [Nocardia arizonensis]|uniref:DUF262 domain-containing protein n=1 Tax=Nocardia arizonensis TaxID=1141647 RepID=UPI0006D22020|nr:DUF262 domain-containing protein [Nocardia arizonensis]
MAGVDESVADDFGEIVEELFNGEPTGVEVERESESSPGTSVPDDEAPIRPWDPEKIRVSTKSFALRNVMDMIDGGDLELAPDFQRNRVWKGRQKSRLIESLLLQIPLPAFYFASDSDGKFRVVDGLQRLSTIHEFVKGTFELGDLEYLHEEHGKEIANLAGPLRRRLLNSQINVHVIEPSTPHRVTFDIFKRLNTGGEPLNSMEIRHCMSGARSRNLLKRFAASEAFIEATGKVLLNHVRMQDREAALRFIAFRGLADIEEYSEFESLEGLLDETVRTIDEPGNLTDDELENRFTEFESAMVNAKIVFGDRAFRKWPSGSGRRAPFNRALFESWAVALADFSPEDVMPVREEVLNAARYEMAHNPGYVDSISSSTASMSRVRVRFELPRKILRAAIS